VGFPIDTNLQDMERVPALNSTPSTGAKPGVTEPMQRELAFGSSVSMSGFSAPESRREPQPVLRPDSTPGSRPKSTPEGRATPLPAHHPGDPGAPEAPGDRAEDDARSPLLRRASRWIAVAGGCGYVPLAPGTAGSAAGALFFMLAYGVAIGASWMPLFPEELRADAVALSPLGFVIFLSGLIGVLTLIGIWASGWAERDFCREGGHKDDGRIVIDEVVGQLIALAPLPLLLGPDSSFLSAATAVVTGFVLFRLFDVWKPGAVRWAERRFDGGLGVMADDLVAGVYAAGVLTALVLFVTAEGFHLTERLAGLFVSQGLLISRGLS
jgi:phosphatidylglycerophosphatase A